MHKNKIESTSIDITDNLYSNETYFTLACLQNTILNLFRNHWGAPILPTEPYAIKHLNRPLEIDFYSLLPKK